jgi:predicted RNA binding protein YcfA (HicA-like mRNA interferase family)/predicted RNase H-like HicB family nuclease
VAKTYREVRRALASAGWVVARRHGSHEIWIHPARRGRIVVAGKPSDTVPVGTLVASRGAAMSEYVVGAYLPDLPGVVAVGSSHAEAADRIKEALRAYSDDVRERGEAMPAPTHAAGTVAA